MNMKTKEINVNPRKNIPLQITATDNIFDQLAFNNCDDISIHGEFIDNSIAAAPDNSNINVDIKIGGKWIDGKLDLSTAYYRVTDNCSGIPASSLEDVLSPGKMAGIRKGLNEHGLGMKTAIVSFGGRNNFHIITKTKDSQYACKVTSLSFEKCSYDELENFPTESGTEIEIRGLTAKIKTRKEDYTAIVVPHLGAKYRKYLSGNNYRGIKLNLTLSLMDENDKIRIDKEGVLAKWDIPPVNPRYRNSLPQFIQQEIVGDKKDWSATFTFGLAPSKNEYKEWREKYPRSASHPYCTWNKKIDVVMHDKVICQIGIGNLLTSYSNCFLSVRGEIVLQNGFQTSMTKDHIQDSISFQELKEKIVTILTPVINQILGENEKDNEKALQSKIKVQKEAEGCEVSEEYAIEAGDGYIDLLINKEAWELKARQASGGDIYKLLWYIDMGKDVNKTKGTIVATSFSPGCKETVKFVKKTRGITIQMIQAKVYGFITEDTEDTEKDTEQENLENDVYENIFE